MNTEVLFNSELSWNIVRELVVFDGMEMQYEDENKLVRFTSNNSEHILDLNLWLLDSFPRYMPSINYGEDEFGNYFLNLHSIRREVA